jgi:hypothetical protein
MLNLWIFLDRCPQTLSMFRIHQAAGTPKPSSKTPGFHLGRAALQIGLGRLFSTQDDLLSMQAV